MVGAAFPSIHSFQLTANQTVMSNRLPKLGVRPSQYRRYRSSQSTGPRFVACVYDSERVCVSLVRQRPAEIDINRTRVGRDRRKPYQSRQLTGRTAVGEAAIRFHSGRPSDGGPAVWNTKLRRGDGAGGGRRGRRRGTGPAAGNGVGLGGGSGWRKFCHQHNWPSKRKTHPDDIRWQIQSGDSRPWIGPYRLGLFPFGHPLVEDCDER